jgi:hypothetical protein
MLGYELALLNLSNNLPLVMLLVLTEPTNPSNVLYLLHGCLLYTTNADFWDLMAVLFMSYSNHWAIRAC